MTMTMTWILKAVAALLGLAAVIAGAMAAHAIADPHAAAMVEKAALYALIHAAIVVAWTGAGGLGIAVRGVLCAGILLFSGSIMGKYIFDLPGLAALAPAGGVLLMAGWALLALYAALNRRA